MKNIILLLFSCITVISIGYAQNNIWNLAPNYLEIGQIQPLPLPIPQNLFNVSGNPNLPLYPYDAYDGQLAEYASNMITKPNGTIEFFIVDGMVYDGWGNLITELRFNINNNTPYVTGASEILIIPYPGICNKYYVVTALVDPITNFKKPYFFLLNFNLPNLLSGDDNGLNCTFYGSLSDKDPVKYSGVDIEQMIISQANQGNFIVPPTSGDMNSALFFAGTKERSDGSRLVFMSNNDGIYTFKVDLNGFNVINYISFGNSDFNSEHVRSEMEIAELSNGNYRIAVPYMPDSPLIGGNVVDSYLYTADISPTGNVIVNTEIRFPFFEVISTNGDDFTARPRGIEFSEDGRFLYITHTTNSLNPNQFEYFDFNNLGNTLSAVTGTSGFDLRYSGIERGFNNSLYLANQNGLYQLIDANNPSSNFSLASGFTYTPNFEGENAATSKKKFYMLPDQIDGDDYFQMFNKPECCQINKVYDQITFTANSSGIWEDNITAGGNPLIATNGNTVEIRGELRIPQGITVTIKDMIIEFAPGGRLVVENGSNGSQGGKLILDNTTLTIDNDCGLNEMWLGVEVWGNQNESQGNWTNSSQGRFEMKNNSKIEHAFVGTLVSKRFGEMTGECDKNFVSSIQPFQFDDSRNGGIVQIKESVFEQNQRGIRFRKYLDQNGANNLSFISNSRLDWIAPLMGGFGIQSHLMMEDVKGIRVIGSIFRNSTPIGFAQTGLGIGILSRSSQFSVNRKCTGISPMYGNCAGEIKTKFDSLQFGIHATNTTDNLTFALDNSLFNNCASGVHVIGTQNERINKNSFFVRIANNNTVGISLFNSSGYTVMENELIGIINSNPPNVGQSFGIVVENSGTSNNMIYKNLFKDLFLGAYSLKTNGSTINEANFPNFMTSSGLHWKCNTFGGIIQSHDLAVNGKIDYNQGYVVNFNLDNARNSAIGNVFSINNGNDPLDHDIIMATGSQPIRYVHLADNAHTPDFYTANKVAPIQATFAGSFPVSSNIKTCPSKLGKKISIVTGGLTAALFRISELELKIDQGNAATLLALISSGNNPNEIKNALLDKSPFLSDEILLAYLGSSASSGMKKDVLIANAHLTDVVMSAVMNSSLPIGTKNQILNAQNGISQRELVLMEIDYLKSESSQDYNEVLSRLLLDSTSNIGYDEAINFLNSINDTRSKKMLVDIYLAKNDQQNMTAVKSQLLSELNEPDYFDLQDVKEQLRPQPAVEYAFENVVGVENQVEGLANNSNNIHVKAKSKVLLEYRDGHSELPDFLPLFTSAMMLIQTEESEKPEFKTQQVVSIYPNPSTGLVNFDYPDFGEGILSVQLYDLNGKEMYSHNSASESNGERVDLSHIKKGMYLVRVSIDGEYIETQKLFLK